MNVASKSLEIGEADAELPFGLVRADPDGRILSLNAEAGLLLGRTDPADARADLFSRLGPAGAQARAMAARLVAPGDRLKRRLRLPDGARLSLTLSRGSQGGLIAALERDAVSDRLEEAAHRAETRFDALADGAPRAAIFTLDAQGRVERWSRSARRLEGVDAAEAVGAPLAWLLERARFDVDADALLAAASRAGMAEADGLRFAYGGGPVWVKLTLRALRGLDGAPDGFLAVARIGTEASAQEAELRRLAATDPLTGVLNRRAFFESVETSRRVALGRDAGPAAILCDIDGFKRINDTHGHAAGDAALRALAEAAQGALRIGDLIGRLGGDEFAVALPGADAARAAAIAERLRTAIAGVTPPIAPHARTPRCTASFGVAAPLTRDESFPQTLARADAALYRAKRGGRNRVAAA